MYNLYITNTFKRKLKSFLKRHSELEGEIERRLDLLRHNPFNYTLKTHKLSGKLKKHWAFWLTYEYRILFIIKGDEIYLTNIGSHDEIY